MDVFEDIRGQCHDILRLERHDIAMYVDDIQQVSSTMFHLSGACRADGTRNPSYVIEYTPAA